MPENTDRSALGERMKEYERACRMTLPRRMPVILRVDGRAFHNLTRDLKLEKPFDNGFAAAMNQCAIELCMDIQGAQVAYVQSDEISVFIHNYKRLNSGAWFENQMQKMVSVAASVVSTVMSFRLDRSARFDARVFVLPEAEVCNYFIWRQQDATRNSLQMLARSLYPHETCDGKSAAELQELCWQAGHNWAELPTWQRRGRFALLNATREWDIDCEPPILTQDRDYVNRHLAVEEE